MTGFMKNMSRLCTKTAICTFISQIQKALKSLQVMKKNGESEDSKKRIIRGSKLTFLLNFVSSTLEMLDEQGVISSTLFS